MEINREQSALFFCVELNICSFFKNYIFLNLPKSFKNPFILLIFLFFNFMSQLSLLFRCELFNWPPKPLLTKSQLFPIKISK